MSDEWITEREVVVHHLVISNSLWPQWTAAHQTSLSFTISKSFLNSCPLRQGCHPTISSSLVPFSSCPQSFPASGSFSVGQIFTSGGQRIGASASASVLPMNWIGLISFRIDWFELPEVLRDSQKSSPSPQFKSINFLALRLLCGPTLTSIHDYWKSHSVDYMDLCQQSDVSAF